MFKIFGCWHFFVIIVFLWQSCEGTSLNLDWTFHFCATMQIPSHHLA